MAPSLPDSSRSNTALALGATASAGLLAGFLISRAQAGGEVRRLLRGNWALLSRQDRATAACLVANGQGHLLRHWPLPGTVSVVGSIHGTLAMQIWLAPLAIPLRHARVAGVGLPMLCCAARH